MATLLVHRLNGPGVRLTGSGGRLTVTRMRFSITDIRSTVTGLCLTESTVLFIVTIVPTIKRLTLPSSVNRY